MRKCILLETGSCYVFLVMCTTCQTIEHDVVVFFFEFVNRPNARHIRIIPLENVLPIFVRPMFNRNFITYRKKALLYQNTMLSTA